MAAPNAPAAPAQPIQNPTPGVDPAVAAAAAAAAVDPAAQPPRPPPAQASLPLIELDPDDRAAGATSADGGLVVPPDAFKKIKTTAANKGRREYERQIATRAAALGYGSVDEMFQALESGELMATPAGPANPSPATPAPAAAAPAAPAPAPAAAQPPAPRDDREARREARRAERGGERERGNAEEDRRVPETVRKKLKAARTDMQNKVSAADQKAHAAAARATAAEQALATERAARTIREDMIRGGAREVDYLYTKMQEHIRTLDADKTPEGQAKFKAFDVKAWIGEQKKAAPYLFGEVVVPANTGTDPGPAGQPAAPQPGAVAGGNAAAGAFDARKASPQELKDYYAKKGINIGTPAPARR